MPDSLASLAVRWRTEAQVLRQRGQETLALMTESFADELETALHEYDQATLTLREAAVESGYSADHLGKLIREGKLPNAGRRNAPRLRRRDLPAKLRPFDGVAPFLNTSVTSREQIVRSVVNERGS